MQKHCFCDDGNGSPNTAFEHWTLLFVTVVNVVKPSSASSVVSSVVPEYRGAYVTVPMQLHSPFSSAQRRGPVWAHSSHTHTSSAS